MRQVHGTAAGYAMATSAAQGASAVSVRVNKPVPWSILKTSTLLASWLATRMNDPVLSRVMFRALLNSASCCRPKHLPKCGASHLSKPRVFCKD